MNSLIQHNLVLFNQTLCLYDNSLYNHDMNKTTFSRTIPQFDLYGESSLNQDPGFVHIENISARSSENGWLIKPHRHGKMFQLLCMYDGCVDVQFDDKSERLKGSWVITIPPGVVHGFKFTPNKQGIVLTLAEPILTDQSQQKSQLFIDDLSSATQSIEFHEKDVLLQQLQQYLVLIESEIKHSDIGQHLMLEWLVRMVMITLRRQLGKRQLAATNSQNNNQLLALFRQLLDQHYQQQWKVQQYASAMNISVSTLNRLCHESIGVSTKAVIQERIVLEAKRKLIYTRESLSQIAYSLGYLDPAYFSRFFKKMTDSAPSEYRQNNNYETTSF